MDSATLDSASAAGAPGALAIAAGVPWGPILKILVLIVVLRVRKKLLLRNLPRLVDRRYFKDLDYKASRISVPALALRIQIALRIHLRARKVSIPGLNTSPYPNRPLYVERLWKGTLCSTVLPRSWCSSCPRTRRLVRQPRDLTLSSYPCGSFAA